LQVPDRIFVVTVSSVGSSGLLVEFVFICELDKSLVQDETNDDADRKGATAEPKRIDFVARLVIPAKEFVEIQDVALEAPSENAAQDCQRLER
jgi:hypothetical protein